MQTPERKAHAQRGFFDALLRARQFLRRQRPCNHAPLTTQLEQQLAHGRQVLFEGLNRVLQLCLHALLVGQRRAICKDMLGARILCGHGVFVPASNKSVEARVLAPYFRLAH